ncbi:MAG: mandelate racemase/muconate lactonizing enzyme family protein, partial [Pirellulaceae bacterium]|jgi:hypothetical protein|nr:mandelate racemase/muconate lactonizing enzyme family protein [Pirellulaceae bacterium]
VTEIERHSIQLPYHDWLFHELQHFYGPTKRFVYVAKTNVGLVGLGEGGEQSDEVIAKYVGTNPFDHIGDETSLQLGTAMYDLMGKAIGKPVYKLLGQPHRKWVPAASWTVSASPKSLANAVLRYAAAGYTWMKYHLSPFENVIDQMRAMQKVAPRGFKIHFDVTMGGTTDHIPELVDRISQFPIAGCFEDPLPEKDIEGYAELKRRSKLPILYHHSPLGATFEVLRRAADGYILGHQKIGAAMQRAGLFAAAELPFSLQNVGGEITRSMTLHLHSAFKAASLHFNSDAETWKDDVVRERRRPVQGRMRVPEEPGLGVTLDPVALDRLKKLKLPEQPKWIIKSTYDDGSVMYNLANPKESIFMVRPDGRRELPFSYVDPLKTEWWDDDGSPAFAEMKRRLEKDGAILKRGP